MKTLKYSLFLLTPLGPLSAAVITFNGLTPDDPLTTAAPGWTLSEANSPTVPIAYVGILNGSPSGALGGEFSDMAAASTTATLTMASLMTNTDVTVSMDMLVKDSTNSFPTRDQFGFSIADGSGAAIMNLNFLPVTQSLTPGADPAQWRLSYLFAGGSEVLTSSYFSELQLNSLSVTFTNNLASIHFNSDVFTGSVSGFDSAVNGVGDLGFNWTKGGVGNGDDVMYFDNLSVLPIPEPTNVLLSGLGSLILLRRRRR